MNKKLTHDSRTIVWLTLSNIIKSLSQWGILVILIKFFSTEEVGYFTLAMALTAPVFMLTDMQLKSVMIVEPLGENDNFRTYQTIRLFTTLFATIGLIIYCIFAKNANKIILAIILYKAVESNIDILYGYLQKCDKMVLMSKLDILKTATAITSCAIVAFFSNDIVISLSSLFVVSSIYFVINNFNINRLAKFKWRIKIEDVVDIVKKSFPLGVSVFFSSYIINYPRISIESICGTEFLAYFGSYSYLAIGMFQIYVPLQIFLRQRLSKCYQNNNRAEFISRVNKTVLALIALGVLIAIGFWLFGSFLIRILYEPSYLEYSDVMYSLILSQTLTSISGIIAIAVLSFNIYTRQAFISLGVLAVVLIACPIFITHFGIYGGGYISIIASALSLICYGSIYFSKIRKWNVEK